MLLSWIAIAVVAAGLGFRVAAMLRLRHRFSPVMAVQHEHELETEGPYAWVRHPGYLGALLSCLGGALAFGSVAALPLVALMLWAQLTRLRREERLLASHFGERWHAYAARTGALVPMLGRVRVPETAGDA
jgi:protein-S-isoprenylcysteine O-methyltransferase Ste14